jgi:hypothetical protein
MNESPVVPGEMVPCKPVQARKAVENALEQTSGVVMVYTDCAGKGRANARRVVTALAMRFKDT